MHMGYFDRQNMIISKYAAELIKSVKILVIGVGAGGNEVLKNLLLMGFGNITIVDFDTVEDSNLSRTTLFRKEDIGKSKSIVAAERLRDMALHSNPNIVGLHGNLMTDFGKGLFIEHDIVICCVDTQKCRAYINDLCVLTKTPFFEMGFSRFDVDICFFAPEGYMTQKDGSTIEKLPSKDGAFPTFNGSFPICLREVIGVGNFDEKRNACSALKKDDVELTKIPTIQVSAAMAGVLVATELVKYLDGKDTIRNKMLLYFGLTYETLICNYERDSECKIHNDVFDCITIKHQLSDTIADVISNIEDTYKCRAILYLPDEFVFTGKCHICGETIEYNKQFHEIYDKERWCKLCRETYDNYEHIIEFANRFEKVPVEITRGTDKKFLNKTLSEVGVPLNDILKCAFVYEGGETQYKYIYLKQ